MKRLMTIVVVLSTVIVVPFWTGGWQPDVAQIVAVLLTAVVIVAIVFPLLRDARAVQWPSAAGSYVHETNDRRVEELLSTLFSSEEADAARLRRTLLSALDERLMTKHGLSLINDPEATALLGPRLQRLVERPSRRLAHLPELRAVVSELENI